MENGLPYIRPACAKCGLHKKKATQIASLAFILEKQETKNAQYLESFREISEVTMQLYENTCTQCQNSNGDFSKFYPKK